jgi:hypothetical protein
MKIMKKLLPILALLLLIPGALAFSLTVSDVSFNEDSVKTVDLVATGQLTLSTGESIASYIITGNKDVYVTVANNVLSFSAKQDYCNSETITINATNNTGSSKISAFKVTVVPVNDAPTLSLPSEIEVNAGSASTYDVSKVASDVDGNIAGYSADYADWSAFSSINQNTGLITINAQDEDINSIHSVAITVTDSGGLNVTGTTNFIVARASNDNKLTITDVTIDDVTDDDSQLVPGDFLEASFTVENKLSTDMKSIHVKAWLQNTAGTRLTDKISLDSFTLDGQDSNDFSMKLQVPPETKAEKVYLLIEAIGKDANGTEKSDLYADSVDVERNEYDTYIESIALNPATAVCGNSVDVAVHIWNTGSNDDTFEIMVRDSDLKISQSSGSFDIDYHGSGADVTKTIPVLIPVDAKAGNHSLEVTVKFDDGSDSKTASAELEVLCTGTGTTTETPTTGGTGILTLSTNSVEGTQGQQLKVSAAIKNTGSTTTTYTLELVGTSNWASGYVEPATVTLASGAITDVLVYITPKTTATGDQTAVLNVKSGNLVVSSSTINVKMGAKPGVLINPLAGLKTDEQKLLFIVLIGVLAAFALIVIGKKVAGRNDVKVYGGKKGGRNSEED